MCPSRKNRKINNKNRNNMTGRNRTEVIIILQNVHIQSCFISKEYTKGIRFFRQAASYDFHLSVISDGV